MRRASRELIVKGVPWTDFKNLYGDWGRNLALYVGRVRHDKELQITYGHVFKLLDEKEG